MRAYGHNSDVVVHVTQRQFVMKRDHRDCVRAFPSVKRADGCWKGNRSRGYVLPDVSYIRYIYISLSEAKSRKYIVFGVR